MLSGVEAMSRLNYLVLFLPSVAFGCGGSSSKDWDCLGNPWCKYEPDSEPSDTTAPTKPGNVFAEAQLETTTILRG